MPTQANALIQWWETFQKSSFVRKHPDWNVSRPSSEVLRIEGANDDNTVENKIRSAMKKIQIEDLGNMQATDLRASIPEDDAQGRGMRDLREMEKKMSIKIVFDDDGGHVYLVGDTKKLEKKAFVIRNLLSHYHWRLFGKDVSHSISLGLMRNKQEIA